MAEITLAFLATELRAMRESVEGRLDRVDARLDGLDRRLDGVDARLDHAGGRLDSLEAKLDAATGAGKVTLAFLAQQQARVLDELGRLRDDLTVTAATVVRLDGAVQGLTLEVRGEHARHDRLRRDLDRIAGRVERLEEPVAPA